MSGQGGGAGEGGFGFQGMAGGMGAGGGRMGGVAGMPGGAALGAINGFLVGFLKTRPFLTTLVTLIILRASVNLLNTSYSQVFATNSIDSDAWDFVGTGSVLGIPINAAALFVVLLVCHIFLSRSRYGWHLTAIGASRKAARHAGIRVRMMLFFTYVLSGTLCAASGIFYAARQSSTDSTTGVGWEFQALTAVVLGGVSLAGGKGTVWRAMIGALIIFLLINGLVRMGIPAVRQSEIHDLHSTVSGDDRVRGLKITMHNTVLMSVG